MRRMIAGFIALLTLSAFGAEHSSRYAAIQDEEISDQIEAIDLCKNRPDRCINLQDCTVSTVVDSRAYDEVWDGYLKGSLAKGSRVTVQHDMGTHFVQMNNLNAYRDDSVIEISKDESSAKDSFNYEIITEKDRVESHVLITGETKLVNGRNKKVGKVEILSKGKNTLIATLDCK